MSRPGEAGASMNYTIHRHIIIVVVITIIILIMVIILIHHHRLVNSLELCWCHSGGQSLVVCLIIEGFSPATYR